MLFTLISCNHNGHISDDRHDEIITEIRDELDNKLDVWYPRVVDTEYSGYLTDFSHTWQLDGPQNKMIVSQSRHLWSLSKIALKYSQDDRYEEYAAYGFDFLKNKMWDDTYGGFYQLVSREGEPVANQQGDLNKTLYGNAFGIYGLAAYYDLSGDPDVLELAQNAFYWLEEHSHDSVHGGYFQPLARDGTPDTSGYPKDYNSGIHILEALTELYLVWPDDLLRERLEEMFYIIRDTVTSDKGYMNLYFRADWTHLSYRDSSEAVIRDNIGRDHVSAGHDIETAYLLLEAAHALGIEDDTVTHQIAKKMTDHSLDVGWDPEVGGIYDIGYYFKGDHEITIIRDTKTWWAQAEALNTLYIMANLYPDDPDYNYFNKFEIQWEYIKTYLIDTENGGWFNSGLDKNPDSMTSAKSGIWKSNYHTIRSLLECLLLYEE